MGSSLVLKMRHIIVTSLAAILVCCINTGSGDIITHPMTTEAQIGELAFFNCSTNKTSLEIQWFYYPEQNSQRKLVYGFEQFHNEYKGFRMDRVNSTGSWNLVIPSVAIENAGKYECQDDIGRGDKSYANLIVLGSTEVKSHIGTTIIIWKNNLGIDPNQLVLSCNVVFHGREAPIFEWKKTGDDNPIIDGVTQDIVADNRVIYNLTLKGDSVTNGSSYACYATRSPSKACYKSDNITVVSSVADTSESGIIAVIVIIVVVVCLFDAITAGVVWYMFVHYPKRKENKGHKSKGKCSKDAIIFVLLMAIPCCIGLLLWYIFVFRRKMLKNEKGERANDDESTNLQPQNRNEPGAKEGKDDGSLKVKNIQPSDYNEETGLMHHYQYQPLEPKDKTQDLVTTLRKDIQDQRAQIQQLNETNRSLGNEKQEQNDKIKDLQENIQRLQDYNKSLIQEKTDLETKLNDLERRLYSPDEIKYTDKPTLVQTIKTDASSKERDWISGLAVLGNELFVVHRNCSEMEVYNSDTYQLKNKFQIPEVIQPFDLTSGKTDRCLFVIGIARQMKRRRQTNDVQSNLHQEETGDAKDEVSERTNQQQVAIVGAHGQKLRMIKEKDTSDAKEKSSKSKNKEKVKSDEVKVEAFESVIVRFDASGNLHKPWPVLSGGQHGQLSTCDSNLIVCLCEKNVIKEFSLDGDLIRTVRLSTSAGFVHVLHANRISSMHYAAVSHGKNEGGLHMVCFVDLNGNITVECKDWLNLKSHETFNEPVYFIIDDKQSLLVADEFNRRILLFNCYLKFRRTFITLEDEVCPKRLCFDEAQNMLFVAGNKKSSKRGLKDGRIIIYKIK